MNHSQCQTLYRQYVLPIIDNSSIIHELRHCVETNDAREFSGYIKRACWNISTDLGGSMPGPKGRAYINLKVWTLLNGHPADLLDNMTNSNGLRPHLAELIESTTQPEPQEAPMNSITPTVAFETRHYVYGMDVANLTEGQLIDAIKRIEAEIADLKSVKTKSERIKTRVAELEAMLAKVVEVLDAK